MANEKGWGDIDSNGQFEGALRLLTGWLAPSGYKSRNTGKQVNLFPGISAFIAALLVA